MSKDKLKKGKIIKNNPPTLYQMFGTDYRFVPEHLRDVLLMAHDMECDAVKLLPQIEEGVLEVYDQYRRDERWDGWQTKGGERRCLQLLLEARKRLMNRMFQLTEESYRQFSEINDTLLDLSRKTCKKMEKLYEAWLKDEEKEWRNDCQVCGRIFAEGWEEREMSANGDNADGTYSDYERIMAIIEEVGERDLLHIEFSGYPERVLPNDNCYWESEVESSLLFSYGGPKPYGDFVMCRAFCHLYGDSLYSRQDILRIKMFWADVALTHQRIVTPQGKLL